MALKIPEQLKAAAALPQNFWGKVLGMTPVIMTVIATLLAGLANSEMTKAQYDRALAAQQQSKAGDQWGFFQAKRLRNAIQLGTLDVVQLTAGERAIDEAGLRAFAAALPDPAAAGSALSFLLSGKLPEQAAPPPLEPAVHAALAGAERGASPAEMTPLLKAVSPAMLADALAAAQARTRAFDALLRPIVTHGDRLGDALDAAGPGQATQRRDFAVLRLRYSAGRYDAEARLNQSVAQLHELQVRQSNLSSERHQRRSQRFFYGMLAAQAAVIVSTFAMAARQRSFLWSLAAAAGFGALSFAGYVFLYL